MVPELVPASMEVLILGGGVLVGRALELLLRSTDYSVSFLDDTALGRLALEGSGLLDGVRLLILAPEASAGCREDALALVSARTAEARIEILELVEARQEAQVEAQEILPWPCRTEHLKRRVMDTLLDGPPFCVLQARRLMRTGGVLVRPCYARVHAHLSLDLAHRVTLGPGVSQQPLPGTVALPTDEAVVPGLPRTVALRQVASGGVPVPSFASTGCH